MTSDTPEGGSGRSAPLPVPPPTDTGSSLWPYDREDQTEYEESTGFARGLLFGMLLSALIAATVTLALVLGL